MNTEGAAAAMRVVGRVMDRKYPTLDPIVCEDCGKRYTTWEAFCVHRVLHSAKAKS